MRDGLPIAPAQKPEWIFVKARMLQYAGTLPTRPQGYAGRSGMIIREAGPMFRKDPDRRHKNFIDYSVSQIL
jgi:hypothetical protein